MTISKIILTTALSSLLATSAIATANVVSSTSAATQAATQASNTVTQQIATELTQDATAQQSQLTVTSAIARPSMEGSKNSAAYITLHNNGSTDVTITRVSSLGCANHSELHDITEDKQGVKKMTKIDRMVVPAGRDLEMQKGSRHIMLMNLKKILKVGDTCDIELHTKELGAKTVTVTVVDM